MMIMKMKQAKPYYDVKNSSKRICVLQGGTRSGKTYSIILALIEFAYKNKGKGLYITIARKTFPSLRGTSMRDFFDKEIKQLEDNTQQIKCIIRALRQYL